MSYTPWESQKSDMTEVTNHQQQCDMPVPLVFLTGVEKKARSSCLPVFMEASLVASRDWIYYIKKFLNERTV